MSVYESKANIFKALSDERRLMILSMLSKDALCACKILEQLSISQPTLSHHMKILSTCGLVNHQKVGKWMWYSLNEEHCKQIQTFLNQLLCSNEERKK